MGESYLTISDVMEKFKVSRATVYRWMDAGLPALRPAGGAPRFDPAEVEKWVKEQGPKTKKECDD